TTPSPARSRSPGRTGSSRTTPCRSGPLRSPSGNRASTVTDERACCTVIGRQAALGSGPEGQGAALDSGPEGQGAALDSGPEGQGAALIKEPLSRRNCRV